ncbi:MAG TPA: BatD family protein, partial [Synergistaceae bacterium]|nr:BatD family protein [Synergistaceae bacterium]
MATKRGKPLEILSGKTLFSVFLLLLLPASLCWAAPSAEVHLERNRTTPDRPVTLVLRITGTRETPEVIPGRSSHLRLVSRGQSSSVQIINGSRSEHLDLYYAVIPEKTGILEVPSLELRFPSGARLHTEPLSLEVTEKSSSSSAPSPK